MIVFAYAVLYIVLAVGFVGAHAIAYKLVPPTLATSSPARDVVGHDRRTVITLASQAA